MNLRSLFLTGICTASACLSYAQPEPTWAHKIDGGLFETWIDFYHPGPTLATDSQGNVVVAGGTVGGVIDLDNGPGTYTLAPIGSNDSYVARYTATGQISWGFRIGCTDFDAATGIAIDAHDNIYVSGWFDGAMDMDPGPGSTVLTPGDGNRDIYIAKYDSTGQFLQVMQIVAEYVNPTPGYVFNMDFDAAGNILIGGTYRGDFDLDPGPGTTTLPQGLINDGVKSFVARYSPGFTLLNYWTLVPDTEQLAIVDMEVDSEGGVFITGDFRGTCDFDPGTPVVELTTMNRCAYVARYAQNGTLLWAKKIDNEYQSTSHHLVVTAGDGVVIEGLFSGATSFPLEGGGTETFDWEGGYWDLDIFMAAYNSQGGVRWAKYLPGTDGHPELTEMAYRPDDDSFYTSFSFSDNLNLDPGVTDHQLTAPAFPIFGLGLMRYDNATGAFVEGHSLTPSYLSRIYVALHNSDMYIYGNLRNTLDVDFSPGTMNLTAGGPYSMFLARYCQAPEDLQITIAGEPEDTLDICPGDTALLTAAGAQTFSWFATAEGGSPLAADDTLQVPVSESRWIFLQGTNGSCQAAFRDSIFLHVTPVAVIAEALVTICAADTVQLAHTVSGDVYDSNFPDVFGAGQAFSDSTYVWIEATDTTLGCSVTDSVLIAVNPLPEVALALVTDSLCPHETVELAGGTPAGGSFSGPAVTNDQFGPVSFPGIYMIYYTITDTNGCTAVAEDPMTVEICFVGGTDETAGNAVHVYYSPQGQAILVSGANGGNLHFELYTMDGRIAMQGPLTDSAIGISGFSDGVYLVRLFGPKTDSVFRVAKYGL